MSRAGSTCRTRSGSDLLGIPAGAHGRPPAGRTGAGDGRAAARRAADAGAGGRSRPRSGCSGAKETHTLLVRVTVERDGTEIKGYVVTFDDVTDLVAAQRKAAWADVARRIAHEIRNPLTPIQLSAERLKRKYLREITSDPETFATCTDTIVRHVGDIGRMVEEFSSFARMPAPVMRLENLTDLCRQTDLPAARRAWKDLDHVGAAGPCRYYRCDGRQLSQALTNLLLNAAEAIDGREGRGPAARENRRPPDQRGGIDRHRSRRQRQGPAARGARAPDRALFHDADQREPGSALPS